MTPRKIIIDTDPGQDDAAAIMLALASPELDVLGITAVAGNVPLALTARNAGIITEICGRGDVPVFSGASAPLRRKLVTAEHVHGKSGLDGVELFEPGRPLESQDAIDFIIDTLRTEPEGTVTLCALGPLTNIATVFERVPGVVSRVREIVLMGGGFFEGGNITPSAEFNIYVDPEAADIVFSSGAPITMMPLDVTHKVLTTAARVERLRGNGNRPSMVMADMLEFFERFDEHKYGTDGGPLHDPTVIAWLLDPDMFSGRRCNVEIETVSELTLGATVVDWWKVTDRPENAFVVKDVDSDRFFDLFIERVGRL
ncbi:nucleoside hydrolase [Hoeflea sp. BAL378]|uniref:nucleoside hydrolase n=1 Tax=Hoeflea sp. BAL378 TaxID=1547437 RepID=UPI000512AB89|nr:nucleoside hydrolase [Hoeflea sp. BAL378]KGF68196.1 nucleoside hydrolase [Hoeflea sp. BAL378]